MTLTVLCNHTGTYSYIIHSHNCNGLYFWCLIFDNFQSPLPFFLCQTLCSLIKKKSPWPSFPWRWWKFQTRLVPGGCLILAQLSNHCKTQITTVFCSPFLLVEPEPSLGDPSVVCDVNDKLYPMYGKIPWRRKWPEEYHRWRSLVGYSPGSQRVGHHGATPLFFTFMHGCSHVIYPAIYKFLQRLWRKMKGCSAPSRES